MMLTRTMMALSLGTLLAACPNSNVEKPGAAKTEKKQSMSPKTFTKGEAPKGHPPMGGKGAAHGGGATISGKVLETMDSGGYTYVKLEGADKKSVWAAIRKAPVKVGQMVSVANPMLMKNFKSKSLKRDFETIYFGRLAGGAPAAKGAMGGGAKDVASAHKGRSAKKVDVGKVDKAPGGLTIAELYAQRKALAGKKIKVRGKVTKFNGGIMGRNWLHLQDGSGKVADGSFDLAVTTQAKAKPNDVVLIEGTLAVDKDFGAGYRYKVIVEKAAVTK